MGHQASCNYAVPSTALGMSTVIVKKTPRIKSETWGTLTLIPLKPKDGLNGAPGQ